MLKVALLGCKTMGFTKQLINGLIARSKKQRSESICRIVAKCRYIYVIITKMFCFIRLFQGKNVILCGTRTNGPHGATPCTAQTNHETTHSG